MSEAATPNTPSGPYPLVFEPILKEKVWGGRRLEKLGKTLPEGASVGESWELADLGVTSVSGGGGGAARSAIAEGLLKGQTIQDALRHWGHDLLGQAQPAEDGGFPLLVKFLDAREHLSVQTHPSAKHAAITPEAKLKTESWVVVDAEPGALLYLGIKEDIDEVELARRLDAGNVESALNAVSAAVGDCWTLPSGLVHALGAGVVVAEVQTPSDTTYRLYDWTAEYARPPREMHVEQGLRAATLDAQALRGSLLDQGKDAQRAVVAHTAHYTIEHVRAHCEAVGLGAALLGPEAGERPLVVVVLRGMGAGIVAGETETMLMAGQTALVPACLAADTTLRAGPGTEVLVVRVG